MLKRKKHFMNSTLSIPCIFSCALDSFLEIASCLFLPHLSDLTVRNEFTELLFNTCSRYVESPENSRLLEEIREPIWAFYMGKPYKFTNCKVKHFFGKKLSTCSETVIEPADKQDVTQATQSTASLRPHLCCPDIQNVIMETNAICNTKGCRAKITGNTESKKMVRCTSCNRAMVINNCYMEINTTFQLETTDKQYTVMANQTTLSSYLGEDVYKYKDNVDDLTEKLLLLENVDFKLSTNARMITEIVDHQQELEQK